MKKIWQDDTHIFCPHCEYKHYPWDLDAMGSGEYECIRCNKIIKLNIDTVIVYTTTVPGEED